mgnify:CR=1 FL=1|tara:strand:+ start:512 stop:1321 length:810 start_codon:yes stop_codon:yes gene_type:complete
MSGFSIYWLDLREPADISGRDKGLAQKALLALRDEHRALAPRLAVDLGAGTGSTLRALLDLGGDDIIWRLVDLDGALLDEALLRHGQDFVIEDHQADLSVVEELPLSGARLVTASALFDLASQEFLERLCERIAAQGTGLYAALNYDGTTQWQPTHALDAQVLDAFNRDQRRDKGFGQALGPDATRALQLALEPRGYNVQIATSPWQLDGSNAELVTALINGIAEAVQETVDKEALAQWREFRLAHANSGTCIVGHTDLLALPDTGAKT